MTAPRTDQTERVLEVIMPMAGLASRFRVRGITAPKPLIEVDGTPMFMKALDSLARFDGRIHLTSIIRTELELEYGLGSRVCELVPGSSVVMTEEVTSGAAATALLGAHSLHPDASILVLDCDLSFDSPELLDAIAGAIDTGEPDGLIASFASDDPRFSYAALDSEGLVTKLAEKRVISSNALIGAYFFTRCDRFVTAAEALLATDPDGELREHYMSLVYNHLIEAGGLVRVVPGRFDSFGTPEELEARAARNAPVA